MKRMMVGRFGNTEIMSLRPLTRISPMISLSRNNWPATYCQIRASRIMWQRPFIGIPRIMTKEGPKMKNLEPRRFSIGSIRPGRLCKERVLAVFNAIRILMTPSAMRNITNSWPFLTIREMRISRMIVLTIGISRRRI